MNKSLDDLYNLIANGNKEIKQEIQDLRHGLLTEIDELKQKNKALEEEHTILNTKLLSVERKLKKYNLVIYGVQGDELQTTNEVLKIINNTLQINCCQKDFRDIFRIGKKTNGKNRPVIIETIDYGLKQTILINARKEFKVLQNNKIFFAQDLAQEDYKIKQFLYKHLKEARSKQYNAFIKNNILVVNGEQFTYEYLLHNDIPNMDNLGEAELNPGRETDCGLDTTFSELPVTISKAYSVPALQQEENIRTIEENKKRRFENSPTKDFSKPKIHTRSQNKAN